MGGIRSNQMKNAEAELQEIRLALQYCDLDYREILEDYREHLKDVKRRAEYQKRSRQKPKPHSRSTGLSA